MSYTIPKPCLFRLQRSELAVPGSNPAMIEKALHSNADFIFLDLEDAVAPDQKVPARKNIIAALNELDWQAAKKTVSIRINGLDSHYMYRDVVDIVEQAGQYLDTILIPKVGVVSDLYMVEAMVSQIEQGCHLNKKIGIEALIETALGMMNIETIAAFGGRLEALHFGVADYAASTQAKTINIGGLNPDYPGDQWHFAISRMVVACRANGIRAIDGPFGDFNDPAGYISAAKRARILGCEGKWAIHPSQIDMANNEFSPSDDETNKAKRMLKALEEAAQKGLGAAQLDGRMIDAASARMAQNIVNIANKIEEIQ